MSGELKTLERTAVLEGYVNRYAREALKEIFDAYREMLSEMVAYTVRNKSSVETLHKVFFKNKEEIPVAPHEDYQGLL